MPRKGKGRGGKRLITRYVDALLSLGTLANNTAVVGALTAAADRDLFMISSDLVVAVKGATAGEGPIEVGLAHGAYTVAEIEEKIESAADILMDDPVDLEKVRRKVRSIGMLPIITTTEVMNNGMPNRTKIGFGIPEGTALNIWAYNRSGGALQTGQSLRVSGNLFFKEV